MSSYPPTADQILGSEPESGSQGQGSGVQGQGSGDQDPGEVRVQVPRDQDPGQGSKRGVKHPPSYEEAIQPGNKGKRRLYNIYFDICSKENLY